MKKALQYSLLAASAACILALTNKISMAQECTSSMPCCGGMNMAAPTAETSTNAKPDLLTTCPVSGDKLGADMGKPYVFTYNGQEVKLCCPSCKKDFNKDPEKYIAKIRAADKKS